MDAYASIIGCRSGNRQQGDTMNYRRRLWVLQDRAWDAATAALNDMRDNPPGTWAWADARERYMGAAAARDVLWLESDRAYYDERRGL
jgi:hypothetical protein